MGNIKPIKPSEVIKFKQESIPDAVFQAFNELIAQKWDGDSATIRKDDLLERYFKIIGKRNDRANREKLYEDHSLDIEEIYSKEGWKVNYESPSYGDSDFESYWEFEVKGKR